MILKAEQLLSLPGSRALMILSQAALALALALVLPGVAHAQQDVVALLLKHFENRIVTQERDTHLYNWGELPRGQAVSDDWARDRAIGLKESFWNPNPADFSVQKAVVGTGFYAAIDPVGSSFYRGKPEWLLTEVVVPKGMRSLEVKQGGYYPDTLTRKMADAGCAGVYEEYQLFANAVKEPRCRELRNELIFALRRIGKGPQAIYYPFLGLAQFPGICKQRAKNAFLIFDNDALQHGMVRAYTADAPAFDGRGEARVRIMKLFQIAQTPAHLASYFTGFEPWPALAGEARKADISAWMKQSLHGCQ